MSINLTHNPQEWRFLNKIFLLCVKNTRIFFYQALACHGTRRRATNNRYTTCCLVSVTWYDLHWWLNFLRISSLKKNRKHRLQMTLSFNEEMEGNTFLSCCIFSAPTPMPAFVICALIKRARCVTCAIPPAAAMGVYVSWKLVGIWSGNPSMLTITSSETLSFFKRGIKSSFVISIAWIIVNPTLDSD